MFTINTPRNPRKSGYRIPILTANGELTGFNSQRYYLTPSDTDMHFIDESFSIAQTLSFTGSGGFQASLHRAVSGSVASAATQYYITHGSNAVYFGIRDSVGTTHTLVAPVTNNVPFRLLATREAGVGMKLYIDGTLIDSNSFTGSINNPGNTITQIGAWQYFDGSRRFNGAIGQTKVLNAVVDWNDVYRDSQTVLDYSSLTSEVRSQCVIAQSLMNDIPYDGIEYLNTAVGGPGLTLGGTAPTGSGLFSNVEYKV